MSAWALVVEWTGTVSQLYSGQLSERVRGDTVHSVSSSQTTHVAVLRRRQRSGLFRSVVWLQLDSTRGCIWLRVLAEFL